SPAQQLAVFRIVQEASTNALKYASRAEPTRLSFDWRGPGLALSMISPLSASESTDTPPSGSRAPHGLRGMRERARLAGGWLNAGRSEDGNELFLVTAFIPVRPSADEASA
ncbi:MAG TPA: hypothetical protein VIL55_04755, partial [Naasia sp.]